MFGRIREIKTATLKIMKKTIPIIVQEEDRPIEKNIIAAAIIEMSASVKKLRKGGITFESIVVLTQHGCRGAGRLKQKPSMADVRIVLESLENLSSKFTI